MNAMATGCDACRLTRNVGDPLPYGTGPFVGSHFGRYRRLCDSPEHARQCLAESHRRYYHVRPHWALRPKGGGAPLVPSEVYANRPHTMLPRWQPRARDVKRKLAELEFEVA